MMRKPRAIIYDDEVILLNQFKRWMTQRGYEVLTLNEPKVCPLSRTGSDKCSQDHKCADIIITDFKMPTMTGLELLQSQHKRECKLNASHKAIISGDIDDENIRMIREIGASFFRKPLLIPEFSEWLGECEKKMDLSVPLCDIQYPV